MIKLDGSYGEGGGAIVRVGLALSTLTGKSFEVNNIRKGRCVGGLKNQHLHSIKALQQLCGAKVEGAELGSHHIKYEPGKIFARKIDVDIETAGSITLMLQALLVPCILAPHPVKIAIKGGTDTKWSMPIDYFLNVLVPQLQKYADIDAKLVKRGYYPRGGGLVELKVKPKYNFDSRMDAPNLDLIDQGHLIQIKGISNASKSLQNAEVAERQAKAAELELKRLGCPIDIRTEYCDTLSDGSAITLWAIFSKDKDEIDAVNPIRIGADSLGEKGKKAEVVGKEAAERLLNEINYRAPVDEYLGDNLVPYIALFGGKIRAAKISNHSLTNIYVVKQFLGEMIKSDDENRTISDILSK
jgi:RNA 3'-terminal phosphate cyclase (GTP)